LWRGADAIAPLPGRPHGGNGLGWLDWLTRPIIHGASEPGQAPKTPNPSPHLIARDNVSAAPYFAFMIAHLISKNLNRVPDVWRRVGILWRDNVVKAIPRRRFAADQHVCHTYNEWHLGDNIIHLHFIRKLALAHPDKRFVHAIRPPLMAQLREIIEDLPNVEIIKFADRSNASIDAWINTGHMTPKGGFADHSPLRHEWTQFHLSWFSHLASQMGLPSPFSKAEDLLFDYPALQKINPMSKPWSFLLINSCPVSNQFAAYDGPAYFDPLISALTASGHTVCCTQHSKTGVPCTLDAGLTISGIGHLSIHAQNIIMVSTGPSWPTFNVWNTQSVKLRVICLDLKHGRIGLSPNAIQVKNREEIFAILKARKLI
jgi:hypothetical protein